MQPVLVDASYLIAIYNQSDPFHRQCMRVNSTLNRSLITCEPVIAETLHMLSRAPGAGRAVLESIERGILQIPFSLANSITRVAGLIEKYRDTPADLADACLIQMADELGTGDILTLDSDFLHYRWRRTRRFNLLIPVER